MGGAHRCSGMPPMMTTAADTAASAVAAAAVLHFANLLHHTL